MQLGSPCCFGANNVIGGYMVSPQASASIAHTEFQIIYFSHITDLKSALVQDAIPCLSLRSQTISNNINDVWRRHMFDVGLVFLTHSLSFILYCSHSILFTVMFHSRLLIKTQN